MKSWINRAGVAGGVLCTLLAALLVVLGLPLVGRSRPSYAALATVTLLVFTVTCFAVAAVIAARSRQPLAIYAAVMLVFALVTLIAPGAFAQRERRSSHGRQGALKSFGSEFLDGVQGLPTLKAFGQSAAYGRRLPWRRWASPTMIAIRRPRID